jgi:hypothetical protein
MNTPYHDKNGAILNFEGDTTARFIGYINGAIRTPTGKLVAFYDKDTGKLIVDGHIQEFTAGDLEDAMDILNLVWVG